MQDLPRIVLNRLQEVDGAEAHPDADLLTAFVERSLADSERARMLEHLALCADCRAIVTFALPATEAVTLPQLSVPAANRWFNWRVLQWGVVAAGILAVASIGVVQHRQRQFQLKRETLASTHTAQNETVATVQVPQPSPELFERRPVVPQNDPQTEAQTGERQTAVRKKLQSSTQNTLSVDSAVAESRAMRSGGSVGGVAGGIGSGFAPKAKDEMAVTSAGRTSAPRPGPQFAVPPSSQMVEVQTAEASTVATAQSQISDQLIQNQKELPLQNRSATNLDVVKAKAPTVPEGTSSGASAQTGSSQKFPQASNVPQRWIISSSGVLQRSFDAGTTWEDVDVNSVAQVSASKSDLVASNDKNEKKVRKELVQPRLVFRAVTAIGSEVWAGGNGAMLYYSDDSGAHWVRVLPSSASRVFTGDVTAIEFSDPQHGSVATSYGEVWITGDKGQTWTLQP
jgi:hypothetical protein